MAAAPPPCSTPAAWVGLGPALPPQQPQCEGGMPRSFELRTDIAPDRLQAVEDWLRAEGYEYRHQQRPGGRGPGRTGPAKGCVPTGLRRTRSPTLPVGRLDQRLPVGRDREEVSRNRGTSAGCRAAAARLRRRRRGPPGTRRGTGGGGSTRSPWLPKPPKAPRGGTPAPSPQRPMVDTTPAPPSLATTSKSPSRPGQTPSAAPEGPAGLSRPQQRHRVGPPREDAGRPGQPPAAASLPKGTWRAPVSALWGALQPSGCPATGPAVQRCRGGRHRHRPGGGCAVGAWHGHPRPDRGGHCGRTHGRSRPWGSGPPGSTVSRRQPTRKPA